MMYAPNVVILGNSQSGKTTFTAKFTCDTEASFAELTSHGCNYYQAHWPIDHLRQQINCFDLSGEAEKERNTLFISTAIDIVIIMLDLSLSTEESIDSAAKWLKVCDQHLVPRDQVFFFGTKADVVSAQSASTQRELAANLSTFGISEDRLILDDVGHASQFGKFNRIKNLIVEKLSDLQKRKVNLGFQKSTFTVEEASIGLVQADLARVMKQRSVNYQRQALVVEYAGDSGSSPLSSIMNQYAALPNQNNALETFHQDEFAYADKWHGVYWHKICVSTITQLFHEASLINLMQKMDVIVWSLPIFDTHTEGEASADQMKAWVMNAYAFADKHSVPRDRLLFVRRFSSNALFPHTVESLQSVPFCDVFLPNKNAANKVSDVVHEKLSTMNPLLQEHHIWEDPLALVLPATAHQPVARADQTEKSEEKASEAPAADASSTSNASLEYNCLVLDDERNQDCVDSDAFSAFKAAQDTFLQSEVKDQKRQKALNIPVGTKFKFRRGPDNPVQTLVYILPKTAGKNEDGYNGFYAEEKIFKALPEGERYILEAYKAFDKHEERAVYFLKMFPTEESEIGEGLCEALTGTILDRFISVGIISKKRQRVFAPPRMIYVQGRSYMALWQPAILGAKAFYRLRNPDQKKKNPFKEMTNRLLGFGYDLNIPDDTKFSGLSYYFMIMLILGNHSWHSDNMLYAEGTKAIRFTGVDYGATFRNLLATEEQGDNIWQSLEELSGMLSILRNLYEAQVWKNPGNVKPEMLNIWVHKKYAEFYRNIPGLFDSIANHATELCRRMEYLESNSARFVSLIEQAVISFIDDAQQFGVDNKHINKLCQTIYGERYGELCAQVNRQPASHRQHYQTRCMAKDIGALALRRLYTIGSDSALGKAPQESYAHKFTRMFFSNSAPYRYVSIAPTDASSVSDMRRYSTFSQADVGLELAELDARLSDPRHSNLRVESPIYKIESLQLVTKAVITEVGQLSKDKQPIVSLLLSDTSDYGISSAFIHLCNFISMDKAALAEALEVFPAYANEFVLTHLLKLLMTLRNYQLTQAQLNIFYYYIPTLNKSALQETQKLGAELCYQTLADCVDADMQSMIAQAVASGVSDSVLFACLNGDSATLAVLLCSKKHTRGLVDSHHRTHMDIRPYILAIANGHVSCLKLLLQHQNTINLPVGSGVNLLNVAQLYSQQTVIAFLQREKKLKLKIESMEALLLGAASQGNLYLLKKLLQKGGVNIHHRDSAQKTAIQLAAEHNHPDCVSALIQAKAGLDVMVEMEDNPCSLLMWAARHNHLDCVSALIEEQVALNAQNPIGNTAVMFAAAYGHTQCVKLLIDQRVDLTVRNRYGNTALMLAINSEGSEDCQAAFHMVQAETLQDELGCTDFMWLARQGDLDGLQKLIEVNATLLDVTDESGSTALFYAARCGHAPCITLLLVQGADINVRNHDGDTALSLAAKNGHAVCVKLLVDSGADLMVRNRAGNTPLMLSITNNHKNCISILFAVGAETLQDESGYTDLMWSAKHGNVELLQGLIEGGLQESIKFGFILDGPISGARRASYLFNRYSNLLFEFSKNSAVISKILRCHSMDRLCDFDGSILIQPWLDTEDFRDRLFSITEEILLMKVFSPDFSTNPGVTEKLRQAADNKLLMHRSLNHILSSFEYRQISSSNITIKIDATYSRSLRRAHRVCHFIRHSIPLDLTAITEAESVRCLLELGRAKLNLNQVDHAGNTALMLAARHGHNDCLYVLNEYGADLQVKNQAGDTALMNCALCGSDDGIITLLQSGAAKNETKEYLTKVLQIAAVRGCSTSLAGLIEAGADFRADGPGYGGELGHAALCANPKGVRVLVDAGSAIGFQGDILHMRAPIMQAIFNSQGKTALHYAIKNFKEECWIIKCLEILLQFDERNSRYCYLNSQDQYGNTALMIAILEDKAGCVDLLIQAGADVNQSNKDGNTALMCAARCGLNQILQALITAGAKLNPKYFSSGVSALMLAVSNNHLDCVRILIRSGAQLNLQDNYQGTALMLAASYDYPDCMRILIRSGAQLNLQDNRGKTALMLAAGNNHLDCVRILIQAGAQLNLQNNNGETALDYARYCWNSKCVTALTRAAANARNTSANIGFFGGRSHRDQGDRAERSSQWGYKG